MGTVIYKSSTFLPALDAQRGLWMITLYSSMDIKTIRELLWKAGENLNDEEVEELYYSLKGIAHAIVDFSEKESSKQLSEKEDK